MPFEQYVRETFYEPMGLKMTGFNPLRRGVSRDCIVPTDVDTYFRYDTVQGHVHDMGAALLDGISGHAGLFSTSMELAMILQMLLNDGFYDGHQYLSKETIWQFTKKYTDQSRRGIGFDRKEPCGPNQSVNVAWQASDNTFGHQGFTGIGVWADPDHEDAVQQMRRLADDEDARKQLAASGKAHIEKVASAQGMGEQMRARLDQIPRGEVDSDPR